jgi:hypothetical protein
MVTCIKMLNEVSYLPKYGQFTAVVWRKKYQFVSGEIVSVYMSIQYTLTGYVASAKFCKVTPDGR